MTHDIIINDYFEWMLDIVCGKRYSKNISYRKLLEHLHSIEFVYSIPNDENRAEDGISLRYRFSKELGMDDVPECLYRPCSVLEMMIALALRCDAFMDDPEIGERTSQWFWDMIINLGLGYMIDEKYDEYVVDEIIRRFLDRDYEPDGKGGLFRIKRCMYDLREVEIWYQLCWYLDAIY